MTTKRISKKTNNLLHIVVYIAILLLFANYEANRKHRLQGNPAIITGGSEYAQDQFQGPYNSFVKQ